MFIHSIVFTLQVDGKVGGKMDETMLVKGVIVDKVVLHHHHLLKILVSKAIVLCLHSQSSDCIGDCQHEFISNVLLGYEPPPDAQEHH